MGWGYKVCSACKHNNHNSYSCGECYNGDLFTLDWEDDEYEMVMQSKEEKRRIKELYERDYKKKVEIRNNNSGYGHNRYYCPSCGKQQKDTYKNRREGCFCERCGQRLAPFLK